MSCILLTYFSSQCATALLGFNFPNADWSTGTEKCDLSSGTKQSYSEWTWQVTVKDEKQHIMGAMKTIIVSHGFLKIKMNEINNTVKLKQCHHLHSKWWLYAMVYDGLSQWRQKRLRAWTWWHVVLLLCISPCITVCTLYSICKLLDYAEQQHKMYKHKWGLNL